MFTVLEQLEWNDRMTALGLASSRDRALFVADMPSAIT